MKAFIDSIRELLFRIKLFFFGVRFYEVRSPASDPVVFEQSYAVHEVCNIHFKFQRVDCSDFLLRRGSLISQRYASYIVTAIFDADAKEISLEFELDLDGKPFFFNGMFNGFGLEEKRVLALISDVYLDFLKTRGDFAYSAV